MTYEDILYRVEDGVAVITLNRPDRLNAWRAEMDRDVRAAMRAAIADAGVRVIVLTGAGRGFCAGADMNRLTAIQGDTKGAGADAARSEPFDPAAMKSALAAIETRNAERLQLGRSLIETRLIEMSPSERAAFADRLEKGLRRGGKD